MSELTERLRSFEVDHKPHGWPAIQMRDVSSLLDRIEHLERVLFQVRGCAYPVSTEIDPRGYRWSEAYFDQAITAIDEALKS